MRLPCLAALVVSASLPLAGWSQEVAPPAHVKVSTTFTKRDASGKVETIASPSAVAVSGKQATIGVSSNDGGITFSVTPTVGPDGAIALKMDTQVKTKADPATQNPDEIRRKQKEAARQKSNMPIFHSAIPAEGLYSVEDIAGARRWLKIGRVVDGWTLKSYDEKREVLTLAQLGKVQELTLHKAIVDGLAVTYGNTTTASVKSGESTKFTTPEGVEVEVKVEVIQMTK
jgi:type II secretory pathway component HofQ